MSITRKSFIGGLYLYASVLLVSLSGLVFLILVAKLCGMYYIGIISIVVSASSLAVTLTSSGSNLAVVHQIATNGIHSLKIIIIFGLLLAILSSLLAFFLSYMRCLSVVLASFSALMAFLSVLSIIFLSCLWGLELFKYHTLSRAIASSTKIVIGILLAIEGLKLLSLLLGYISSPLVTVVITSVILHSLYNRTCKNNERVTLSAATIRELFRISFSNYPYMFSESAMWMVLVYLSSYIVSSISNIGVLYIYLSMAMAVMAFPCAILNAYLPISIKNSENKHSMLECLRVGLGLSVLLSIMVLTFSPYILSFINSSIIKTLPLLEILLLSVPPCVVLYSMLILFNRSKLLNKVALLGFLRLTSLVIFLLFLTKSFGLMGTCLAFLFANTVPIPLGLKSIKTISTRRLLKILIINVIIETISIIPFLIIPDHSTISGLISLVISIVLLLATKTITIEDIIRTLKGVRKTITCKP